MPRMLNEALLQGKSRGTMEGARNRGAIPERNDRIIFLRKIIPGAADKSCGIQVARLAGLPQPIIERAKQILHKLEGGSHQPDSPSAPQENTVAAVRKPRAKKTASAEEVNGPVTRQVELELF